MKLLKLILLVSGLLNATDISQSLVEKVAPLLCKKESIVECNSNSYLVTNKDFKLDNNRLLIFFHIYNPNAPLYRHGIQNAIVLFDIDGNFQVIGTLSGSIDFIKRSPKGGIWVSHPWNIEGTTPSISYTRKGEKWSKIVLPPNRFKLSIEWVDICLRWMDIALKISSDNIVSYWKAPYFKAIRANPKWIEIDKYEYNSMRCLSADAFNNNWQKVDTQNTLIFSNNKNSNKLIIPKKIPLKNITNSLYSIQVGHFNRKESMDIVSKQLNEVIAYPLISKTFSNNTYKLFLGTFKTPQEAKDALNRLKRRYKKNIYINEAFITKLPR